MFQRLFDVTVKDKLTKKESTLRVSGSFNHDADWARKFVETMPGSHGGNHPGFEVLDAVEVDADGKPVEAEAAETPAAEVVETPAVETAPLETPAQ